MNVQIKKVKNPFHFVGVKIGKSVDSAFLSLMKEVENYYNDSQLFKSVAVNPNEGMPCVASVPPHWHRAKVEKVLVTSNGFLVQCILVDELSTITLPSNRVFVSPDWVWGIPVQGMHFSLHAVQPARLVTNYVKNEVHISDADRTWDSAAIKLFNRYLVQAKGKVVVDVIEKQKEVHVVKLYVLDSKTGKHICLNEELVNHKFAVRLLSAQVEEQGLTDTRTPTAAKSPTGSIPKHSVVKATSQTAIPEIINPEPKKPNKEKHICTAEYTNGVLNPTDQQINVKDPSLKLSKLNTMSPNTSQDIYDDKQPYLSAIPHPQADLTTTNLTKLVESSLISQRSRNIEILNNPPPSPASSNSSVISVGRGKRLIQVQTPVRLNLLNELSPPVVQRCTNEINNFATTLHKENTPKKTTPKNSHVETSPKKTTTIKTAPMKTSPVKTNPVRKTDLSDIFPEDDNFSEKLKSILQISETSAAKSDLPGKMSAADLKVLLLENLLEVAKSNLHNDDYEVTNKLRQVTIQEEPSFISNTRLSTDQTCKPNAPVKKSKSPKKSKELYVAKTILNRCEKKSNAMLVHGVSPPNPIPLFCQAPFPTAIITKMENVLKYRGPRSIQAYVWPAVLQKRNLVALSPSCGGKTLAYVVPIVTMLQDGNNGLKSSDLNPIQASFVTQRCPKVIVLCSTWKKVQEVTNIFNFFISSLDGHEHHRVIGITGGPVEDQRSVDLFLGCSVLVCSPCTLIRICQSKVLDLTRLEQLVLDDIHTLVEVFTEQVRSVVKIWLEVLNDPDRPVVPGFKPQIMGFGIQWTAGIKSFMESVMTDQTLLYISHPLEAAVYGRVQHHTVICPRHSSMDHLLAIINQHEDSRVGGIAVFVRDVATLTSVMKVLSAMSVHCVAAHGCMAEIEIEHIHKLFIEPSTSPVLVLTDDVISYLDVDSIQVAIHFEFPKDKHHFGMRLSLMSSYYCSSLEQDKPKVESSSFMFFCEDDGPRSVGFIKFLNRLSQPIPTMLRRLALVSLESQETSKHDKHLCPYFQSYGFCRDINVCRYRHIITASLDQPNADPMYRKIPTSGHIRVRVTCVSEATKYYARLVKHRNPITGVVSPIEDTFQKISDTLEEYFSSSQATPCRGVYLHQVVVVRHEKKFYRALPVRRRDADELIWQTKAGVMKVVVHLVDTGKHLTINVDELYELPDGLSSIPYQAIEVRACGVKPLDSDTEWLMQASELVHNLIFEKEIEGNIVLALGHTIWLKPVVIRSKLPKTGVFVTDCDVIEELIASGLAVKNTDHVTKLTEQPIKLIPSSLLAASSDKIVEMVEPCTNSASNHASSDLNFENGVNFEELEVIDNGCSISSEGNLSIRNESVKGMDISSENSLKSLNFDSSSSVSDTSNEVSEVVGCRVVGECGKRSVDDSMEQRIFDLSHELGGKHCGHGGIDTKTTLLNGSIDTKTPLFEGSIETKTQPFDGSIGTKTPPFEGSIGTKTPPFEGSNTTNTPPLEGSIGNKTPHLNGSIGTKTPPFEGSNTTNTPLLDGSIGNKTPHLNGSIGTKTPPFEVSNTTNTPPLEGSIGNKTPHLNGSIGTKTPPFEGSIESKTPPFKGSNRTNTPPLEGSIGTKTPPFKGSNRTNTPPLEGSIGTKTPPFKGSFAAKTPPFEGSNRTNTPLLDGSIGTETPLLEGSIGTKIPPLEGSIGTKTPLFDGSIGTKTPPLKGSIGTKTPPFEGSNETKTPPLKESTNTPLIGKSSELNQLVENHHKKGLNATTANLSLNGSISQKVEFGCSNGLSPQALHNSRTFTQAVEKGHKNSSSRLSIDLSLQRQAEMEIVRNKHELAINFPPTVNNLPKTLKSADQVNDSANVTSTNEAIHEVRGNNLVNGNTVSSHNKCGVLVTTHPTHTKTHTAAKYKAACVEAQIHGNLNPIEKKTADHISIKAVKNSHKKSSFVNHEGIPKVETPKSTNTVIENGNLQLSKINGNSGLVVPICIEFLQESDGKKRSEISESIYITCSELPYEATEKDLIFINRCLVDARTYKEQLHIAGSLLSLANALVAVHEYMDIMALVSIVCNQCMDGGYDLQVLVLTLLCLLLSDNRKLSIKNRTNLAPVAVALTLYLDKLTSDNKGDSKCVELKLLHLLHTVVMLSNEAAVKVKGLGLIEVLIRIKSKESESLRRKLFMKLFTCDYDVIQETEEIELPSLVPEVKKVPGTQKVYDCLDYDRFNGIDTDTDSNATCRPFTPVYAKFDSDSETSDQETEVEDPLLGF